jgi:hypothetical protein
MGRNPTAANCCHFLKFVDILIESHVFFSTLFFGTRQFRKRGEQDKKMGEDTKWKLLVTRVVSAKAMTSLCQSKKNKCEQAQGV